MSASVYVWIKRGSGATTDYGPAGLNVVQGIDGEMSGPDKVGQANIHMYANAAYYDIRKGDLVRVFTSPDGGATITDRLFLGFVDDVHRTVVLGTRLVYYTITVNDANVLLDWMRLQASSSGGWIVSDGGETRIDKQLQRIARAVTYNNAGAGSATFDDVDGMALATVLTADVTFQYGELSLRDAGDKRLRALQEGSTALRPRQFMGFQLTGNATNWLPQWNIYDEAALLAGAAKYTFSWDNPTAGKKSMRTLTQERQGGSLTTSVQAVSNTPGGGAAVRRSTSSNTATYPNTFDQRPLGPLGAPLQAWDGPLLKAQDGLTGAQVQALADQEIAAEENPAETYTFVTDAVLSSGLLPGDTIALDATDLSLSGYKRVVSGVRFWLELQAGVWTIVREVTAGNQLLELGDSGKRQTAPVHEGNATRPTPPTVPVGTFYPQRHDLILRLSVTASTSTDRARYRYYIIVNSAEQLVIDGYPGSPPPITFQWTVPFNSTGQIYVTTVNRAGLESDPSTLWQWNLGAVGGVQGDSKPPPLERLGEYGDFTLPDLLDPTKPSLWTFVSKTGSSTWGLVTPPNAATGKGPSAMQLSCPVGGKIRVRAPAVSMYNPSTSGNAAAWQMAVAFRYIVISAPNPTLGALTGEVRPHKTDGTVMTQLAVQSVNFAASSLYDGTLGKNNLQGAAQTSYGDLEIELDNTSGANTLTVLIAASLFQPALTGPLQGTIDQKTYPQTITDDVGVLRGKQAVSSAGSGSDVSWYDLAEALMGKLSGYDDGLGNKSITLEALCAILLKTTGANITLDASGNKIEIASGTKILLPVVDNAGHVVVNNAGDLVLNYQEVN